MKTLKALLIFLLLALPAAALAEEQNLVEAMKHHADAKSVAAMIQKGADVNAADADGRTPLMMAVAMNYADVARLLLDKGANINQTAPNGVTPLVAGVLNGHPEMVKLLLDHGAKMDTGIGEAKDALTMATVGTIPKFAVTLKGATTTNEERLATLKLLLDRGADANVKQPEGYNPLILIAEAGGPEAAVLFLDHGAKVDAARTGNITPLMTAAHNGNLEVARVLLKRGANRQLKSDDGKTALDYAKEQKHPELVKLLEGK